MIVSLDFFGNAFQSRSRTWIAYSDFFITFDRDYDARTRKPLATLIAIHAIWLELFLYKLIIAQ